VTVQINDRPFGGTRCHRRIWILPLTAVLLMTSCTHATVKSAQKISQPTVATPTKSNASSPTTSRTTTAKSTVVHLQVLNGSGYQCASKYTAQKLVTLGYVVDGTGNSDPISATVIMSPATFVHQASALQRLVPGSKLELSSAAKEIMLVIGQNAATVTGVDLATIPASCGLSH
jgi:hypothetical protein